MAAPEPAPRPSRPSSMRQVIRRVERLFGSASRWMASLPAKIQHEITLHPRIYLCFEIAFGLWSIVWWIYPPAPGKAVLLLAAVAAIVTVQPQMTDRHRLIWIVIVFALFGVEYRAIDKDRAVNQREQAATRAEERQEFAKILNQQQQHFALTIEGLETVIENSDRQFSAAMKRTNVLIDNVTGGNSYAVVLPFVVPNRIRTELPLLIENHGNDILAGVSCTVYDTGLWITPQDEASILRSVNSRQVVGSLHPGERIVINMRVNPLQFPVVEAQGESVRRVFIHLAAQNFSADEDLDFKQDAQGNWLFRYRLNKEEKWDYVTARRLEAFKKKPPTLHTLEEIDWTDNSAVLKLLPVKKVRQ